MEFKFNVNEVLKSPIVEINHTLIPPGFNGDRRALWDSVSKISEIVNAMGDSSAVAQGLNKPITTSDRLRNSDQTIYLLVDKNAKSGKGVVTGMLKTGKKSLYIFDREGEHYKVSPPCILDFYVHESRQRTGLGKQLFEYMLQKEQVDPVKLAIDRPSEKLLSFLGKHYSLNNALRQMNNYVVFDGFFPESLNTHQIEETNTSESPCKAKPSANGLQNFPSPYGRYGAPRPTCSMGQIIHNQTSVQSNEPSGENVGVNQTSLANNTSPNATTQQQNYRNESQPNICPNYANTAYNQQQLTNSNNEIQQNVIQQGFNSSPNIMQQYTTQLPQQSHNLSQHVQFNDQIQKYSQLPSQPITEMQQHEAYSNMQIPQPSGHSQDQSQTNTAYQYYTNVQNQPASNVQSQPISNVHSQPICNFQSQPVSNFQSQPVSNVQSQPISNVQSQPISNVQSQPYPNVQSQPCINNQNQLYRNAPSQPCTNILDQSHTNVQNQPSSSIQNQFHADAPSQHNINAQSYHNINVQGQPFLNSNNQNYAYAPNQSYANIHNQSHANSQPYIQNQPFVNQQNQIYQSSRESQQRLNTELIPQHQTEKLHTRKLESQVNIKKSRQRYNNGLSPLRHPSSDIVPNELCDRGYPDLYRDKVLKTQEQAQPRVVQQQQLKSQYVSSEQQIRPQYVSTQQQPQYVPSQQQQQPAVLQYASSQQQIQLQNPASQLISQQSQPYHNQIGNVSSAMQHTQQSLISHNVSPPNQVINAEQQMVTPQFIHQQQSVPQLRVNEQQNIASTPQIVSWKENVQPNKSICNVTNPQYIPPPNSEQPLGNHQTTNTMPTLSIPQQYPYYDSSNQTLKSDVKQTYNTNSNSQNIHSSYNASGDMIETQKPMQNYVAPTNTDEISPSSARLRTPRSRVHTPRCGLTQQELLMPPTLNQDQSGQIMSPHSVQPQSQHMSGELQNATYESANQSPKLERPRSLSIQCNEDSEIVDKLVLQNVKGEVHFEPTLNSNNVEIADAIEKLEIVNNNVELNGANLHEELDNGDETDRSKSPNPLTAQGFVDLKFYHSRLW